MGKDQQTPWEIQFSEVSAGKPWIEKFAF